jgi:uncharacterized RDD family membrane protein YckC
MSYPPLPPPYGGTYGGTAFPGVPTAANYGGGPSASTSWAGTPVVGWVPLATTGQRAWARVIDSVILACILAVVFFIGLVPLISNGLNSAGNATSAPIATGFGVLVFIGSLVAMVVILAMYEVAFVAIKGATPGKMLLHIKIVDERTGRNISWGRSFARWLIPFAGNASYGVLSLLVYMSFLWDAGKRKQGWHDKIANDLVIQTG